jgi:hypothetical protein
MQPNCHRLAQRLNVLAHIAVHAHIAGLQLVLLLEQPLYLLNGHMRLPKPVLDLPVVEADPLPGRLFENRHLDHRGHDPGQLLLWRQGLVSAQASGLEKPQVLANRLARDLQRVSDLADTPSSVPLVNQLQILFHPHVPSGHPSSCRNPCWGSAERWPWPLSRNDQVGELPW